MLTPADIAQMTPRQAWEELEQFAVVAPLLITKAKALSDSASGDGQWLTVPELARRLNVSGSAVRQRAASDPRWSQFTKKMGKSWRFKRFEVERYLNEGKSLQL